MIILVAPFFELKYSLEACFISMFSKYVIDEITRTTNSNASSSEILQQCVCTNDERFVNRKPKTPVKTFTEKLFKKQKFYCGLVETANGKDKKAEQFV